MPVFQFDTSEPNYWGYMPLNFFSPHNGYATDGALNEQRRQFCDMVKAIHLAGIEVYPSGNVLRSDLQFVGRSKEMLLRGYRASDAIAIALFYDAPILLHRSLLER